MYSAAKCSESVDPDMLAYTSSSMRSTMSREIVTKSETWPLCMKVCLPNTKGWLFTDTTGVAVAARMCEKTHLLAVLAQILRKFVSWSGGWAFLKSAGCSAVYPSALKSLAADVYQATPKPSTLKRRLRAVISCSVVISFGSWERSLGR